MKRLAFIDSLRGFAILAVIINHSWLFINADLGKIGLIAGSGHYGVQLFFVISAFTIFYTLDRYSKIESNPVRNFFIRRFIRIFPLYWFGILIYTIVYGLGSRGWLPGPELWHYPFHILLINLLHPETLSSVVPGGWSISCEILFYLTVPIWFKYIKSIKVAILFCIFTIISGPLMVTTLKHILSSYFVGIDRNLISLYWYRNIFNQIGNFSFGILLYFAFTNTVFTKNSTKLTYKIFITLLSVVLWIFIIYSLLNNKSVINSDYIFSLSFMILALALAFKPWRLLVNEFTVFIGRISYSAYMVHILIIKQLNDLIVGQNFSPTKAFLLLSTISLTLTIPIAWILFKYIETPCIEFGKTLILKLQKTK